MKILIDFEDDGEMGACECGESQGQHHHLLVSPSREWVESSELKRHGRIVGSLVKYLSGSGFDVVSKPSPQRNYRACEADFTSKLTS